MSLISLTNAHRRSVILALAILIGIVYLLSAHHEESVSRLATSWKFPTNSNAVLVDIPQVHQGSTDVHSDTSFTALQQTSSPAAEPQLRPEPEPESEARRANATLFMLARNSDLDAVIQSVEQMEMKFNRKFKYPWVLLNDEPFTAEFKRRVSVLTDAPISFGEIPHEHWYQPDWIDEGRAQEGRNKLVRQGIIYGGSVSYRNMCRFNSGFFYHHELLKPYKWYWRVEPDIRYFCDLDYDPFLFMEDNNKLYGFTISMPEWEPTIPTLWGETRQFIEKNPHYLHADNSMDFLSDNSGDTYNLCHFWSNFEIADMDFWRSEAYSSYFQHLESTGGFYYERWGDAPIHSIAVSLFAGRDQIHFFKDIGYRHSPFQHCPQGRDWKNGRCSCDPNDNFDFAQNSCLKQFMRLF